jgi:integrase
MPKIRGAYSIQQRSKKKFLLTINDPESGLPPEMCQTWQRKSYSRLPAELSHFRYPTSRQSARNGADALIEFLKKEADMGNAWRFYVPVTIGSWLVRFISLDNNPRAERLISKGMTYSPDTIALYKTYYNRYIEGDTFLKMDINKIDVPSSRAFVARIGMKETKDKRLLVGTRAFEITVNFIRMAFTEYWEDHQDWRNPFDRIDPPIRVKGNTRDVLQEAEILKLFMPGVIKDPLERAVAIAMFWAGLRRAEIFGLKYDDLDWKTPLLRIRHAWKRFGRKGRILGNPKWNKFREAPFCEDLQNAIKILQETNGTHESNFVFCRKDGSIPHGKWIQDKLKVWIKNAGIDTIGRKIVPHSSRHSLASMLEENSVPLRYIQDILGHSSLKTTKIYLHTPQGKINEITKKIEKNAAQSIST